MKIVEINSCNYGSTGSIMLEIASRAREEAFSVITCCAQSKSNQNKKNDHQLFIGSRLVRTIHTFIAKLTDFHGCYSIGSTIKLLIIFRKYRPDIIHLHNLHGDYVCLPIIFGYIKKNKIKVIWTLHDCWSFTGHCTHFELTKCDKWKTGCYECPSYKEYPQSLVDNSRIMWELKKKWFTGIQNMTIVTPSQWLADLVKQSYLKDYPVKVINNGIDLSIFKPTASDFRNKYDIPQEKFILLGVAFGWGVRKGLDVFIELSERLDPKLYQIVLVGTDEQTDKQLPNNIISIHRTQNRVELVEIYSAADLFVNPTREEVLGMVNVEALACGTPGVTFNTGGSPECYDDSCGSVVPCDVDAMEEEIIRICEMRPYKTGACLARAKNFDMNDRFKEYVDLYNEILSK